MIPYFANWLDGEISYFNDHLSESPNVVSDDFTKRTFFFFGAGDVLVSIQELQTKEKEIQKNFPTQR